MTLLSDPRLLDVGASASCPAPDPSAPRTTNQSHQTDPSAEGRTNYLVLVADERQLDTAYRILSLAQAVRSHCRAGARVVCVIREHPQTTFGRGRLWVGRVRRGDREPVGRLTPALVAEAVRLLRVAATTLKATPALTNDSEPDSPGQLERDSHRILALLRDGIAVIVTSSGAGPAELASTLDAKLIVFDPGPPATWERPARVSPSALGRRDTVTQRE
jgi:hypothetical protein